MVYEFRTCQCGAAEVWANPGNHVKMWLQAPLRDHWAQGDVDLYEVGSKMWIVGNSYTRFKQQVEGGRRVRWQQIRWPSCDASCCRSCLSLCRKATLPGGGGEIVASIYHCCEIVVLCTPDCARCTIMGIQYFFLFFLVDSGVFIKNW